MIQTVWQFWTSGRIFTKFSLIFYIRLNILLIPQNITTFFGPHVFEIQTSPSQIVFAYWIVSFSLLYYITASSHRHPLWRHSSYSTLHVVVMTTVMETLISYYIYFKTSMMPFFGSRISTKILSISSNTTIKLGWFSLNFWVKTHYKTWLPKIPMVST